MKEQISAVLNEHATDRVLLVRLEGEVSSLEKDNIKLLAEYHKECGKREILVEIFMDLTK